MTLKDDIAADIDAVFFDDDEFAEEHVVEGAKILCVVDTCRAQASSKGTEYGLSEADYVLYAKTKDLPRRKAAGSLLRLDGRDLTISRWDEEDGVTSVELFIPEGA